MDLPFNHDRKIELSFEQPLAARFGWLFFVRRCLHGSTAVSPAAEFMEERFSLLERLPHSTAALQRRFSTLQQRTQLHTTPIFTLTAIFALGVTSSLDYSCAVSIIDVIEALTASPSSSPYKKTAITCQKGKALRFYGLYVYYDKAGNATKCINLTRLAHRQTNAAFLLIDAEHPYRDVVAYRHNIHRVLNELVAQL